MVWEISEDGKTLIQPLSSVKGLGEKAIEQVLNNRPFNNIEEFLFNESVVYSKLNKKALDVLCRSGALDCLRDDRFTGTKHFWSSVAVDRPRKEKNLLENIEKYAPEGDFTEEEMIQYQIDLTGVFPFDLVMGEHIRNSLEKYMVPPISEYDGELGGVVWCIPREVIKKKTKNGKDYYIVRVIDDNNETNTIRCWGVRPDKDVVRVNRPYMMKLDWNPQWGFSTRKMSSTFRLLG